MLKFSSQILVFLLSFAAALPALAQIDVSRRQFLGGLLATAAPKIPVSLLSDVPATAIAPVFDVLPLRLQLLEVLDKNWRTLQLFRRMAEHNLSMRLTGSPWYIQDSRINSDSLNEELEGILDNLIHIENEMATELRLPVAKVHLELLSMIDPLNFSDLTKDHESLGYSMQDILLEKMSEKFNQGWNKLGPGAQFLNNVVQRQLREGRPQKEVLAAKQALEESMKRHSFEKPKDYRADAQVEQAKEQLRLRRQESVRAKELHLPEPRALSFYCEEILATTNALPRHDQIQTF